MLRTTLRQSRSISSLRVAAAATPIGARGLASSALFNKVSWESQTVPIIKKELAQRGLSTVGKKSVLVSRLNSAEASFPSVRSTSSSPPAFAPPKTPAVPKAKETEETNTETVTAPATAEISSPATAELPRKDVDTATSSPGLPNNPFDGAKKTLDVKMPAGKEDADEGTAIPTILGPGSTYPPSAPKAEEPEAHPKLMTTASASTHIDAPRSHAHAASDSHAIDVEEGAKEADSVATGNRDLTDEERYGLWVAAAILGGSYFLSLGVDKISPAAKAKLHDAEDKIEAKLEKGKKVVGKKLDGAKDKLEGAKDKAEDLLEDGKKKAGELVKDGKKKADQVGDKVGDAVDEGKKKAEGLVKEGKDRAEDVKDAVKEKIE